MIFINSMKKYCATSQPVVYWKQGGEEMSIAKYQVFLKVASCGSFTRAAEELHFTQSGVSHTIAALENELGVPLFVRNRGGVTMTADGRSLLPYIQALCDDARRLEQRAENLRGLETGLVRVATFNSVSVQWLPYILKSFREEHPRIEFELLPFVENAELEGSLLSGEADCCFLSLPTAQPLDCWTLHQDQWKVIVSCDHPLAGQNPFPLEALATEPFIYLQEGDDYEIKAVFDKLHIQPNIQYILRDDPSILAMVATGLGISIMPKLELEHCPYPLAVCDLPHTFYRTIGIAVKDKSSLSLSTRRFVEHTCQWVQSRYPSR